jgi:two-component system, NarL family, response regulator NreC
VHLPAAQIPSSELSVERVRCVLVDEQVLVRQGIGRLLREHPGVELAGEGASLREAMGQSGFLQPDVVIVGADQDRHVALETARLARMEYPSAQLIFLLTYLDDSYRAQCERAGVSGFVLKTAPAETLHAVLSEAYNLSRKGSAGGPVLIENALRLAQRRGGARHLQVTRREEEVLRLIAEGNSARSAAAVLGLSVKTVEAHKFNFMRKLGLHNRAQVINYALRKGLVRLPVAE